MNKPPKPPKIDVNPDEIPAELTELPQWVCWRYDLNDNGDKWDKIPYQTNGRRAKSNEPRTWTSFSKAIAANSAKRFDGIGFVFSESDPFCGVDIDDCLQPDLTPKEWAIDLIAALTPVAYIEVSPSGTGVKAWTKASLPPDASKRTQVLDSDGAESGEIEIYVRLRYFTVTGNNPIGSICEGQEVVDRIFRDYFKPKPKPQSEAGGNSRPAPSPPHRSTSSLIRQILSSKQRRKFGQLFEGDWRDYQVGNEGASRADQALCSMIAFWTQDPAAIDAVFRQSGMMRSKWDDKHASDGRTYGQLTIDKALGNLRKTFNPKPRNQRHNRRHFSNSRRNYHERQHQRTTRSDWHKRTTRRR